MRHRHKQLVILLASCFDVYAKILYVHPGMKNLLTYSFKSLTVILKFYLLIIFESFIYLWVFCFFAVFKCD